MFTAFTLIFELYYSFNSFNKFNLLVGIGVKGMPSTYVRSYNGFEFIFKKYHV